MDVRENDREEYTPEEREAVTWSHALSRVSESALRSLGHSASRRAKQRAVALLLGHASGTGNIRVWALRETLLKLNIYNEPNFAQDMKKDSDAGRGAGQGLWVIDTYRGGRRGLSGSWRLTTLGAKLASEYAALVEGSANAEVTHRLDSRKRVKESVARTFVIRPKAATCAFCREDVTDTDKATCTCGSAIHATCLLECGVRVRRGYGDYDYVKRDGAPCILRDTTARCAGTYKIIAKPEAEAESEAAAETSAEPIAQEGV